MTRNFEGSLKILLLLPLFTGLFTGVISAYDPPRATVLPLHPKGIRISVPDEQGITLVAFHVKFNEDFDGLEAGTIARDIIKPKHGRWTYEDKTTKLRKDDVVYYWVHVVYEGLGYNLLDQSHRVVEFYDYNGVAIPPQGEVSCSTESEHTMIEQFGIQFKACREQLLFEDNFDNLNGSSWVSVERFSGAPDYEFNLYRNSNENLKVLDGKLLIKPTMLEDKYDQQFVRRGSLSLARCTGTQGSRQCLQQAEGFSILPPVISGLINTQQSLVFLYGRILVRAKLPKGDWLYPLIYLDPMESVEDAAVNGRQSSRLCVASSAGNANLRTVDGKDISGHVVSSGGLFLSQKKFDRNRTDSIATRFSSNPWSNDYHDYELVWTPGSIIMKVDGVEYGSYSTGYSHFNRPMYLNLGLAVGGHGVFPDSCTSGSYTKPWRNSGAKALLDFYNAKDSWMGSWRTGDTDLKVDYVKIWAL